MKTPLPASRFIYHITHVENLPGILATNALLSDARMIALGGPRVAIGMTDIKRRRLTLPVTCHAGLNVGDCVPFYFCPRSVMLFLIHRANNPQLGYRGGQGPIVHLEADLASVVDWANGRGRRWAFSPANAAARYTQFHTTLRNLNKIDWAAVAATNFAKGVKSPSGIDVAEGKQAEFLLEADFPWGLVRRVGVASPNIAARVQTALAAAAHKPRVSVESSWYF